MLPVQRAAGSGSRRRSCAHYAALLAPPFNGGVLVLRTPALAELRGPRAPRSARVELGVDATALREVREATLTAAGQHVGLIWESPRNAWGHWDYIDLGVSDEVRPLTVKLEGANTASKNKIVREFTKQASSE